MPALSLSETLLRPQVIEAYLSVAQHLPIQVRQKWFHEEAERRGCAVTRIRRIVTGHIELQAFEIENESFSRSQKIAVELGATQTRAIQVLNAGMRATRKKSYTVADDKGHEKVEFYEEPDFTERRQAATKVLEIHGAFAPKEVNLNVSRDLDHLTDAELNHRLAQATIAYHQAEKAAKLPNDANNREPVQSEAADGCASGGADGPLVHRGPLLLADQRDALEG